jgi:hypothetical protein
MPHITRRDFAAGSLAARALAAVPAPSDPAPIGTALPAEMLTFADTETGRRVKQFTSVLANSYPLYYFTPSITPDGNYCVIHSERGGWVQLYRLDLRTGAMVQLTNGTTRESGWSIWCEGHLRGIFNHLSALNPVRREVYYFQDEEIRSTHLDTLANRLVHRMPGRMSIGQTSFSPDGRHFAFIHAGAKLFRERIADREALLNMRLGAWDHEAWRNTVPCTIGLIDTETGRYRDVIRLDFHVHHVIFAGNETLLVNHTQNHNGMWSVKIDGSGRRDLQPLVHQVVTSSGIFYEDPRSGAVKNWFGLFDLKTGKTEEVPLPAADGYMHTGLDPAGKFLFFENAGKKHELISFHFPFIAARTQFRTIRRIDPYPARGGQRFHAHPFLSPGRKWLFHTAVVKGYSQVCAVDVADLVDLDEYWSRRS